MTDTTNGRPRRKQLSDQLDRLDTIIDALAEGLNKAVADAAREGTRLAVKDAILEILANPELRSLIAAPVAPNAQPAAERAPPEPGASSGLRGMIAAVPVAIGHSVRNATGAATRRLREFGHGFTSVLQTLTAAVPRVPAIVLGTGVVALLVCAAGPHVVTTAVGAACVAVVAAAAAIGSRLRRAVRWLGMV